HLVNFGIYLFSLSCFSFFLTQLIRARRVLRGDDAPASESVFALFGYVLFGWAALELITITIMPPDMLQSGFMYLSFGLLMRMNGPRIRAGDAALLGSVLGLGSRAKAPTFLLAFVFLAAMRFRPGRAVAHAASRVALAGAVFAAIALLMVIPLSH